MKAWDTNLLIRHLTEDDAAQLLTVRGHLAQAERRGEPVWIADVTLVETYWVLQHVYHLKESDVLEILIDLTEDARFLFQSGSGVLLALGRTKIKGDLPEHLIALAARRAGVEVTQTFDRAVRQFSDFEVI